MTARDVSTLYQRRAARVDPILRKATLQVGRRMLFVSNQLMTREIYAKPEDKSATGRPLWRRTGQLAAKEMLVIRDRGLTAAIRNETVYAEPRHEANKPGRRKINPARTAHWRDDMVTLLLPEIRALMGEVNFQIIQR